jgi:hypothetical protein
LPHPFRHWRICFTRTREREERKLVIPVIASAALHLMVLGNLVLDYLREIASSSPAFGMNHTVYTLQ